MNQPSAPMPDRPQLRERLSRLTAAQRQALAQRLASERPGGVPAEGAGIPLTSPMRVEAAKAHDGSATKVAVYPASPGQVQMWYHYRLAPESPVYNSPMAFQLRGPVNATWLESAFRTVIARHDTLRTTFAMEGEELRQRVTSDSAFRLEQMDGGATDSGLPDNVLQEYIQEVACRPFDLTREPQIRAALIRLRPDDYILVITLHHINSDGWSRSNLVRELSQAYEALSTGAVATLPPLPIQYVDYAADRIQWLRRSSTQAQFKFWQDKLAGDLPHLSFPGAQARPALPSFRGDSCWLPLESKLWCALQQRAKTESVTLFTLLLASFKTLLLRATGEGDLRVGVPIANRHRVEIEGLIGLFINTLVVRTALDGALEFEEVLQRVKHSTLEALAHSDVPFQRVVEIANQNRAGRRTPLLQTLFALQDFPALMLTLPGVTVVEQPVTSHTAKLDLSIAVERDGHGWKAHAEFSTDLLEQAQVQALLADWKTILEKVAESPRIRVSEIPVAAGAAGLDSSQLSASCYLIGEGALPIRCGEILLSQGLNIIGVAAPEGDSFEQWARERELPLTSPDTAWAEALPPDSVDFIFSINNTRIIPAAALRAPRRAAINYHDALLPRYAGLHAPAWVILRGETQHGITWHEMVESVDAGPILKQRSLPVTAEDTAITLGRRCLEAAADCFAELLQELKDGRVQRVPQDLSQRTYYSHRNRPPAAGIICWDCPAEEIRALVRALDFSPFHNPMGLPKIFVGDTLFAVSKARRVASGFRAPPGTIVAISQSALTVTTATEDLEFSGFSTLEGEELTMSECAARFRLHAGQGLPPLDPVTRKAITLWNEKIAAHESFWTKRLEASQSIELPSFAQPRHVVAAPVLPPVLVENSGAECSWTVPAEVNDWLARHNNGWTRGELLLAALGAYLARVSEAKPFDVGFLLPSPPALTDGLAALVSCAVPLRFDGDLDRTLEQHLASTRAAVESVTRRGAFPRDLLARVPRLRQRPDLRQGYAPLITIAFPEHLAEVCHQLKTALLFLLPEQSDVGRVVFDPQRIDAACVNRILEQYGLFLRSLAAGSGSLRTANLLPAAERHTLLTEWNETSATLNSEQCIHWLIEEQACRRPDAVAVVHEGRSLTYAQLIARADQLAQVLRPAVAPDSIVGLFVTRSIDMIIGVLGILKAGAAYLPIDPASPSERIRFMVEDGRPRALVTVTQLASRLPAQSVPVVSIDAISSSATAIAAPSPKTGRPQDLAYVIYTSGSTGRPNGVLIEHRSLVNYTLAFIHKFALGPDDRILQFASLAFDASVEEIFGALASGAALVLRTEDMIARAATFLERCAEWDITVLPLPTAYWHFLVPQLDAEDLLLPPGMRLVMIGGERALPEVLALWQKTQSRVPLFNGYGPTETTVAATWSDLSAEPVIPGQPLPIGRPLSNTSCYVLDQRLEPVPIGVAGELCIGGNGLARGYLNRPELTATRFIVNPFSPPSSPRLYRTGDKVRYRPDGMLEFLGRFDDQVKIRGYRIELGEVESVLATHPQVQTAAVVLQATPGLEQEMAAVVVERGPKPIKADDLRKWLAQRLPEYMVPAHFTQIDRMPLTINGKLDRKALAQLTSPASKTAPSHIPARTELERELVKIWETTLRREKIGTRDNFFELGGHSLLAMVINARMTQLLKVDVPLRWLLENPTVEALASKIETSHTQIVPAHAITKVHRDRPLPLSFSQEQMWLLQQTIPNPAAYNVPCFYRFCGVVDPARVRASLRAIAQRHEILRTALVQRQGELIQEIADDDLPLPWVEREIAAGPGEEGRKAALQQILSEEARHPFDLSRAPLWRALWLSSGSEDHVLALTFHHTLIDEWTLRIFLNELSQLYAAGGSPSARNLKPLPVQFADYAVWQRQHFTSERLRDQTEFWNAQLSELPPPLQLPSDRARPAQPAGVGAVEYFELAPLTVSELRRIARQENATLFAVLLAGFQAWLFRYTQQSDLLVGLPVTRRNRPELQNLIGFFLNTLPLRAQLEGTRSFRQQLRQTRDSLTAASAHSDLPYQEIAKLSSVRQARDRPAIYQVMFAFSEETNAPFPLGAVEGRHLAIDTATAKSDLTLNIRLHGDSCDCKLEYSTELFTPATAARMVQHLIELFRAIAQKADCSLAEINLISPGEKEVLLHQWNMMEQLFPAECTQQLFEAQTERRPTHPALVLPGCSLSYGELNTRANHLALRLRGLGIGPDVLVGLCAERSFEMIIGLLAILKAGGACVPLDPTLPQKRLQYMVSDAGCPVVLTQTPLLGLFADENPQGSTQLALTVLDPVTDLDSAQTIPNPPLLNSPADLAYVLYTSGSTGQPKGVEMPHRALVNLVHWQGSTSGMRPGHRTLQFASLGFDVAFQEIFSTLGSGGTLVLVSQETRSDPNALLALLAEARINRVFLPFVMLDRLAQAAVERAIVLADLQEVFVAGEQLRINPAIRRFFDKMNGCRLWNHYGPTESHVVTAFPLDGPPSQWPELPPIGRPIANSQVYILDAARNLAPVGVLGELFVGGVCLSRGYRRRPDLTDQRYFPNPCRGGVEARLYRTGDLCRWRNDGQLEYVGRLDQQVKIRGFRVELGEIESVLSSIPGVREAVVTVRESAADEKQLVAYIASDPKSKMDEGMLKTALRARLPEYMVPAWIEFLLALPLTPNGKVDHRALPAPKAADIPTAGATSPRNRIELELTQIWQRLFERTDIACNANFFDLGGHSLLAARLVGQIESTFGCKMSVATLFQSPSITTLAQRLSDSGWCPRWVSLVPLQPLGTRPPLFMPHGWGGDVFSFLRLTKLLGQDQPFYGFQAVGLDGETPRHASIEQMAAHYVSELRAFRPRGPYCLAGYSMGGLVAFEMAQQLWAQGQSVAFLGLLDTFPKAAPWLAYVRTLAPYLKQRWQVHLQRWRGASGAEKLRSFAKSWEGLTWWIGKNRAPANGPTNQASGSRLDSNPILADDYYWSTASRYRLRCYPGSIDLFLSEDANPVLYPLWGNLSDGGITLHKLGGSHLQILFSPEHLSKLTETLQAALDRASVHQVLHR